MESGDSVSQNKRKERVKSIFDSDDSDEDDKAFGHSPSNDEDEDDDLRKQIDEVCFNLSNEEEKLELGGTSEKGTELSIPVPKFTMDEVTGSDKKLLLEVSTDKKKLNILDTEKKEMDPIEIETSDKLYDSDSTDAPKVASEETNIQVADKNVDCIEKAIDKNLEEKEFEKCEQKHTESTEEKIEEMEFIEDDGKKIDVIEGNLEEDKEKRSIHAMQTDTNNELVCEENGSNEVEKMLDKASVDDQNFEVCKTIEKDNETFFSENADADFDNSAAALNTDPTNFENVDIDIEEKETQHSELGENVNEQELKKIKNVAESEENVEINDIKEDGGKSPQDFISDKEDVIDADTSFPEKHSFKVIENITIVRTKESFSIKDLDEVSDKEETEEMEVDSSFAEKSFIEDTTVDKELVDIDNCFVERDSEKVVSDIEEIDNSSLGSTKDVISDIEEIDNNFAEKDSTEDAMTDKEMANLDNSFVENKPVVNNLHRKNEIESDLHIPFDSTEDVKESTENENESKIQSFQSSESSEEPTKSKIESKVYFPLDSSEDIEESTFTEEKETDNKDIGFSGELKDKNGSVSPESIVDERSLSDTEKPFSLFARNAHACTSTVSADVNNMKVDVIEELNEDVIEELNKDVIEELNKDVIEELNEDKIYSPTERIDHENSEEINGQDSVLNKQKIPENKSNLSIKNIKDEIFELSEDKIPSSSNEDEIQIISEKLYEKNVAEEIKKEVEIDTTSAKHTDIPKISSKIIKIVAKDSDLANLSDVWKTVNIFQTSSSNSVTIPDLNISPSKEDIISKFEESDSDSGTDVNDKIDSNLQLLKTDSKPNEVKKGEIEVELVGLAQTLKDNTSSPWEAMKNGSLFEDVQVVQGQSPEYQNAESLKRKKVRVEDVFTDSEGDETPRKTLKIKDDNEVLKIKEEPEGSPDKTQSEAAVKKVKRRVRATSINLPAIMLAFEKGWVREVVYRSSSGIANKRADVCYYTPLMRKIRSRLELEEYLSKNNITDLGLQNFSFFKEPLGVEEKYERIRHSSNLIKLGDCSSLATNGEMESLPKKRARKPTTKVKESPLAKKPKTKEVVKKVMIKEAVSKQPPVPAKRKTSIVSSATAPVASAKPPYQMSVTDLPVYATHLYPANPPLTHVRIITPVIRGEAKDKTFHCTPACEAGGGNVPSLQCVKCVCLFHSECCQMPSQTVSLILSSVAKFLCPNCYREETTTKNYSEEFKPSICFEPLAFDPSSESEDEGLVSDFEHPLYKRVNARPKTPPLPPFSTMLENSKQFSSFRAPTLNVPALQQQSTCMPPSSSFQAQQPQLAHLLPSLPLAVPIPSTSAGPTSYLIYQPISKTAVFQQPAIVPTSQITYKASQSATSTISDTPTGMLSTAQKKSFQKEAVEKPLLPQIAPGVRGGQNFMGDMSAAYQILRRIFIYLSVPDLLNISKVCSLWRDLALSPYYWNCVRLRNVCVRDWDKMVEFLDRRGTVELDLRKMVIYAGLGVEEKHLSDNEDLASPAEDNFIPHGEDADKDVQPDNDVDKKDRDVMDVDKNSNFHIDKEKESEINENDVEMKDVEVELTDVSNDVRMLSPCKDFEDKIQNLNKEVVEKSPKNVEASGQEAAVENECHLEKKNEEIMKTEEEKQREIEQQKEKEEIERKEKEEREKMSYIVSSVLSEHDYFGVRTVSTSSSSSSSSSSTSSTDTGSGESTSDDSESETHLDITEEEIERSLQRLEDKIKIESRPDDEEDEDDPPTPLQEPLQNTKLEDGPEKPTDTQEKVCSPHKSLSDRKSESRDEDAQRDPSMIMNKEDEQHSLLQESLPVVSKEWQIIASALEKLKSLRRLLVGTYDSSVAEVLLSTCHQLTSFSSLNFDLQSDNDVVRFDPSVLMQTRKLEELRLASQKSFTFKSNFNFIKLPRLKVLMLKGLKTTDMGWPYLGIHLTHLYLSFISTFSHNNWLNITSMSNLVELELDGSGSDHDSELCTALGKLNQLSRLTLLDWNIGSKLPHTLKRLHNIKYLHIIPAVESENMRGVYAGRLMVVLEAAKYLNEFIWGIQPQNIIQDEDASEKIFILNMKAGKETGSVEGEEVRSVSIDSLKGFIKCRIPHTKISVKKVSSNIWTWIAVE